MTVSLEHLVCLHDDSNYFLFRIVTKDKSWVHYFTPVAKVTSMERKIPSSPVEKSSKQFPLQIWCSVVGPQCDSATATQNHIATPSWEHLHHPQYISDIAPSDFRLFPASKENFAERCFGSNAEVTQAVKRFFRMKP
ncbi:hypothetical protein TNCV_1993931 [Trichonephila clavipes]|nr:hypothetical protein TNCV_1993931 [Trichonephila clavipes]